MDNEIAGWISAHGAWFETASKVLYVLGALALALNIWRAISFSSLVLRGAQLLNIDVRDRRRDLENRLARLEQRVGALSAEADAAAKRAEAAGPPRWRKGGVARARPGIPRRPARPRRGGAVVSGGACRAHRQRPGGARRTGSFSSSTISTLCLPAQRSRGSRRRKALSARARSASWLSSLSRLVDPLGGLREARRRLDKWLQVVVNLPRRADLDGERLVARLLATDGQAAPRSSRRRARDRI